MLPRFLMLLWVPVVVMACFAFTGERAKAEEALASWYGPGFSGLPTASGEPYDPFGFTAAHKTMPLGTELLVGYGGNSVEVIVNDRGPYVGERELDLSQGAAQAIGLTEAGVDVVQYSATEQYAAPALDVPTTKASTQYSSSSQYDAAAVSSSESTVYETQYSAATQTVDSQQYAVAAAPVEEPAGPVAAESASGALSGSYVSDVTTSGDTSSALLVVRPGETLSGIAQQTGVSVEYLTAQNEILDPDLVYAGQVIYY